MSEGGGGEWDTISSPKSPASLPSNNLYHSTVVQETRDTGRHSAHQRSVSSLEELFALENKQLGMQTRKLLWPSTLWSPGRLFFEKKGKPLIFYIRQIQITTSGKLPMIPCIMFPRESSVRGNQWFQLFRYKVALKLSPL